MSNNQISVKGLIKRRKLDFGNLLPGSLEFSKVRFGKQIARVSVNFDLPFYPLVFECMREDKAAGSLK